MANTDPLYGSLIEAGGSAISGIASALTAKANRDWQEREAMKQRQWQSMPEQVARARMAGLNPNLVFGKGSGVTNVPSVPSAPAMPTYNPLFSGLGALALGVNQLAVDKSLKETEAKKNITSSELDQATKEKVQSETRFQDILNQFEPKKQLEMLTKLQEDARKAGNEADQAFYEAEIKRIENDIAEATQEERKKTPKLENELTEEKKKTERSQQQFNKAAGAAQTANAKSNRIAAMAQQFAAFSQDKVNRKQAAKLRQEAYSIAQDVKAKKFENIKTRVTLVRDIERFENQLLNEKIITKEQWEHLRYLQKQNDWYEIMNFAHTLSLGAIGLGQAAQGANTINNMNGSKPMGKIGFR